MSPRSTAKRAVVLAASVVAVLALTAAAQKPATIHHTYSDTVWSGMVNVSSSNYLSTTMDVVVPSVTAKCGSKATTAIWTGLGGYGGLPFAQNGFSVDSVGIAPWYEVFEASGKTVEVNIAMPARVKVGDKMLVSEGFSANHAALTMTWNDLTVAGNNKVVTLTNASKYYGGRSAEYVIESAPTQDDLMQFSPVVISAASSRNASGTVIDADANGDIHNLVGPKGNALDSVAASSTDPTVFSTTWKACS